MNEPAATLNGAKGETKLKGAAVVMEVTFSAAVPVLLTVRVIFGLCPTLTLPKATCDVLRESVGPETVPETPAPLSDTVAGDAGSLLTMLRVPLAGPAAVGEN